MADELSKSSTLTSQPPPGFVRLVREALAHLYDPAYLLRHPLSAVLADVLPSIGNRAREFRTYLLDAIECLEPPSHPCSSEKERRPYLVLVDRYVGGLSTDEIAARLHVGPRQVRREHEKGVQALAANLWPYCAHRTENDEQSGTLAATGLRAELDSLGVEFENLSLADVMTSAQSAAAALAEGYGVVFSMLPASDELCCLCDRTLAKQALLSCLDALSSRRPRYLEVCAASFHRLPSLRVNVMPPLSVKDMDSLRQDLATCRTLMSAQGGNVRLLRDEGGLCSGIRLSFLPEGGAHVLAIDDNAKMLRLYERYLAGGRYRVSTATSAQEAEALIQKAIPDVIVLDVMMREVDGWELLQRLRSEPSLQDVPIVVCSVLNEPKLAFFLGAQAYLKKPVVADDLLAALHRLLDENSRGEQSPTGP